MITLLVYSQAKLITIGENSNLQEGEYEERRFLALA